MSHLGYNYHMKAPWCNKSLSSYTCSATLYTNRITYMLTMRNTVGIFFSCNLEVWIQNLHSDLISYGFV